MTASSNYDDALSQLQSAGLDVYSIETGRLVRCKIDGDRGNQKTGWYSLHELRIENGDTLIVGAYGNWRDGSDPQTGKPLSRKIDLKKVELTNDERDAIKARITADRKRAENQRKAKAEKAARRAEKTWKQCSEDGHSEYLNKKKVKAYGVRFSPSGNLVIPLHDAKGKIHGLQVIYSDPEVKKKKGRDKDFWPVGLTKRGHFFMIGSPTRVIIVVEGYATGASIFEATQGAYAVIVTFDAGNILPAAQNLKKRYRKAQILIAADDDYLGRCRSCRKSTPVAEETCQHCGEPHGKTNVGINSASAAALAVGGVWQIPQFEDRGTHKWTDFNDLAVHQSPYDVGAQLEALINELQLRSVYAAPASTTRGRGDSTDADLRPIMSVDELHERFALVYGQNSVAFDFQERRMVKLSDVRDLCYRREIFRDWMESPDKKVVRIEEVGFDPSESDPKVKCNLFGGWPTNSKSGPCEDTLSLLEYMCNDRKLLEWVLRWCAYPIQNPGAKLKTALVLHGPQGVGKNMFFEALMAIYGQYGRVVGQDAVEDRFNDWASKILFLIADEMLARQELYHSKNKVKGLITGDEIRINPKNIASYTERNHVNIVFMSNEVQPLVLEQDDRRFVVIWTPEKLSPQFYEDVKNEIDNGGIEALHDHLLNLDMGDFKPWTLPPMTQAKQDLIDLGMDSTERFITAWLNGELEGATEGVPVCPCLSKDFYKLYRAWCSQVGIPKYAPSHILLGRAGKHPKLRKWQSRYLLTNGKSKRAMMIFPINQQDPPDGMKQQSWLAKCIKEFQKGFNDWLEANEN